MAKSSSAVITQPSLFVRQNSPTTEMKKLFQLSAKMFAFPTSLRLHSPMRDQWELSDWRRYGRAAGLCLSYSSLRILSNPFSVRDFLGRANCPSLARFRTESCCFAGEQQSTFRFWNFVFDNAEAIEMTHQLTIYNGFIHDMAERARAGRLKRLTLIVSFIQGRD